MYLSLEPLGLGGPRDFLGEQITVPCRRKPIFMGGTNRAFGSFAATETVSHTAEGAFCPWGADL